MLNLSDQALLLLINAFLIIGFSLSTDENMLLHWVRRIGDKFIPEFWRKPIYDCPTCMASLHSIYPYFLINGFSRETVLFYPVYILSLAGLTTYLNSKL